MSSMINCTTRRPYGGTGLCRIAPTSRAGTSARAISSTRIWRQFGSIGRQPVKNRDRKHAAEREEATGDRNAPPSFDAHCETTYAPFYSLLIRVNPQNPARRWISYAVFCLKKKNKRRCYDRLL